MSVLGNYAPDYGSIPAYVLLIDRESIASFNYPGSIMIQTEFAQITDN